MALTAVSTNTVYQPASASAPRRAAHGAMKSPADNIGSDDVIDLDGDHRAAD